MGGKVPHLQLGGPLLMKEICLGTLFGIACASVWKMQHLESKKKTKTFYEMLDRGEIRITATQEEEQQQQQE